MYKNFLGMYYIYVKYESSRSKHFLPRAETKLLRYDSGNKLKHNQ